MITITILGTGRTKCKLIESNISKAAQKCGVEIKVEKSRRADDYRKYRASMVPALIVREKVVSAGRILSVDELCDICISSEARV